MLWHFGPVRPGVVCQRGKHNLDAKSAGPHMRRQQLTEAGRYMTAIQKIFQPAARFQQAQQQRQRQAACVAESWSGWPNKCSVKSNRVGSWTFCPGIGTGDDPQRRLARLGPGRHRLPVAPEPLSLAPCDWSRDARNSSKGASWGKALVPQDSLAFYSAGGGPTLWRMHGKVQVWSHRIQSVPRATCRFVSRKGKNATKNILPVY
jgi:hypothetical protein